MAQGGSGVRNIILSFIFVYNKYQLDIGRYGPDAPQIIGKGTYTIWQYTESGKIDGISCRVDIYKFNPKYGLPDILMPNRNRSILH